MRGLITFEGIEGSGKSTQIRLAAEYLEEKKIPFLLTAEPAGTSLGVKIADVLFNRGHFDMCAETELLLFCAARAQHVREKIIPALQAGEIVLCDRFSDATYAYQGFGRGLKKDLIKIINDYSSLGIKPDMTLLFDLPAEKGLRRAEKRNEALADASSFDRFEKESIDFHRRVREGYLSICREEPARFRLVDAAADARIVQGEVRRYLMEFINS